MLLAPPHSLSGTSPPHPQRAQGPPRPHSRAGEVWWGSGRPLCRQLAPAGKGINITKSGSERRAAGLGLCGEPGAGGARGRRLSRTRTAGLARRRQWVQASVPDACACACVRVRAFLGLRSQAWDADAPTSPYLQRLSTHPLSILASRLAFFPNAILSTFAGSTPRNHQGNFPQARPHFRLQTFLAWPRPPTLLTGTSAVVLSFSGWTPPGAA